MQLARNLGLHQGQAVWKSSKYAHPTTQPAPASPVHAILWPPGYHPPLSSIPCIAPAAPTTARAPNQPCSRASVIAHARRQRQQPDNDMMSEEFLGVWGSYEGDYWANKAPSRALLTATNKHFLPPRERQELRMRLRRESQGPFPWPGAAQGRALRLYRYALDDLRLYRAIAEARMEGLIVVVETPDEADVVVATTRKRTGRGVNVDDAKRAAGNAGIPCIKLETLSAVKLMRALEPITGVPVPRHLVKELAPSDPRTLPVLNDHAAESQQVLQLLQAAEGMQAQQEEAVQVSAVQHRRPRQLRLSQPVAPVLLPRGAARGAAAPRSWGGNGGVQALEQQGAGDEGLDAYGEEDDGVSVDDVDVHDDRAWLLPPNPKDWQGPRHLMQRPPKPGSRALKKKLMKELAEKKAPW